MSDGWLLVTLLGGIVAILVLVVCWMAWESYRQRRQRPSCLHRRCWLAEGYLQYCCMACGRYMGEAHALAMVNTHPPFRRYFDT